MGFLFSCLPWQERTATNKAPSPHHRVPPVVHMGVKVYIQASDGVPFQEMKRTYPPDRSPCLLGRDQPKLPDPELIASPIAPRFVHKALKPDISAPKAHRSVTTTLTRENREFFFFHG